ncbi:thaumatin-like protein [Selaginella moellendorffii]|uniref:thaumatin-like protein n=1 Tax=Selaginella moellendorffii TaxID=88036 RepID=UPI000D1CB202|nr:thaumatin-like protein [Selaginella moellendorffii]|eukprot:XP_024533440.1 thaumatin-like protein [Selaginella moellendorffii]
MASSNVLLAALVALSLCFAAIPVAAATSFNVVNRCGGSLNIIVRENAGGPSIGTSGFTLSPGASRRLSPPNRWAGNIGTGTPGLLAEFSINSNSNLDFYDISAVDGFFIGTGMSITGSGRGLTCRADAGTCPPQNRNGNTCASPNRNDPNSQYARNVRASCPDAYSWSGDDTKTFATGTGGTFSITFCPSSINLFAANK